MVPWRGQRVAPFCLAIRCGSFSKVPDAPRDREEDRAAADDVHEVHEVPPREPRGRCGRELIDDDDGHVDQHLHTCAQISSIRPPVRGVSLTTTTQSGTWLIYVSA